MSKKNKLYSGLGILAISFCLILMIALMGRYEATKRSSKEQSQRQVFAELDEKLHDAVEKLKRLPVLYKERVQPLDTLARGEIRRLSGRRGLYGAEGALVFCSIAFDDDFDWKNTPLFLVSHGRNKKLLGMESTDKLATLNQIADSKEFWALYQEKRAKWADKASRAPQVDFELFRLAGNSTLKDTRFADAFKIVPPTETQVLSEKPDRNDWHLVKDALRAGHDKKLANQMQKAFRKLKTSWQERDSAGIIAAVDTLRETARAMEPKVGPNLELTDAAIENELSYNSIKPFTRASWFFAVAAAFAVFSMAFHLKWLRVLAIIVSMAGLGFCVWGFYMRITLGFQIAVTNLYESMIAVGCLSVLMFLIVDLVRKTSWGLAFGGLTGFMVLQIVDLNSVKFDDGITGPMAVLANNIWIHIHVPVVMSAYCFYVVAFLMSLFALPWILIKRNKADEDLKDMLKMSDIAVNLGSVFMLAGLILGGVWAQVSWGRFWGWDPKETWGLILFLWFLAIVHGRFTKKINAFWNAWLVFLGGNVLLWTYYGTNELLSGLHSYAGATSGEGFVGNLVHEKNRWFVWTSGTMFAISIITLLAYLAITKKKTADRDLAKAVQ